MQKSKRRNKMLLSRKFLLSLLIAIVGTILMANRYLEPEQWQWCMTVTILSYITSLSIQEIKIKRIYNLDLSKLSISRRIRKLFTRDFILTILLFIIATIFLAKNIITNSVWFYLVSALTSVYNIGNSVQK